MFRERLESGVLVDVYYFITSDGELKHYGVLGMKWGVRRARKNVQKAKRARESAKEWDEIARNKESKGHKKSCG